MGRQPSSPGSGSGSHALLFAAAENVTGLVLDDDDAQFIKEESSSPGPDDDRDSPFRRQAFKFKSTGPPQKLPGTPAGKPTAAQERSRRHGGKAASRANHPKGPPAAGQPIVPRKTEDWDPWKSVLYELYITQNRILRDIIGIMEAKHNLRAT
jgi:hypothetical protein